MGINHLIKYLQKKVPNAFSKSSDAFENQKIAIDASIIMYKYRSSALKIVVNKTNILENNIDLNELNRIWISMMIKFLCHWLTLNRLMK